MTSSRSWPMSTPASVGICTAALFPARRTPRRTWPDEMWPCLSPTTSRSASSSGFLASGSQVRDLKPGRRERLCGGPGWQSGEAKQQMLALSGLACG